MSNAALKIDDEGTGGELKLRWLLTERLPELVIKSNPEMTLIEIDHLKTYLNNHYERIISDIDSPETMDLCRSILDKYLSLSVRNSFKPLAKVIISNKDLQLDLRALTTLEETRFFCTLEGGSELSPLLTKTVLELIDGSQRLIHNRLFVNEKKAQLTHPIPSKSREPIIFADTTIKKIYETFNDVLWANMPYVAFYSCFDLNANPSRYPDFTSLNGNTKFVYILLQINESNGVAVNANIAGKCFGIKNYNVFKQRAENQSNPTFLRQVKDIFKQPRTSITIS